MPNRILKDSICESRALSEVSFFAEDLYKRLITYADDYGRFNADPQIILARLYPREIGIVSIDDLDEAITELVGVGKIAFYTAQPRKELYGCFPNWASHQRVRDSKKKFPDPTDTTVNDWYYKRFISKAMKAQILTRDGMVCQECGVRVIPEGISVERAIKMCAGTFHIDHIVPVNQGGRCTEENLRLLCPTCNLRRKRHFTIEEIMEFTQAEASCENSPQLAANCGNVRPNPIQSNTIRIQSLSESLSESYMDDVDAKAIQHDHDRVMTAAEDAGFKMTNDVRASLIALYADSGLEKVLEGIKSCSEHGAANLAYLRAVLRGSPKKAKAKVNAQGYEQRDYQDVQDEIEKAQNERILSRLKEMEE